MLILNGENSNSRRRVPIHLVNSSDGISALTGQTGSGKISMNYGAPKTSVNSIVEIDSTNMPGDYYLELTPLEVKDLGMGLVRIKTGSSAEYVYPFQVVAYDPFNKLYGEGGTPLTMMGGGDISYSKVRTIVAEEVAKLPRPIEAKETDLTPISEALQALFNEVRAIDIPKAKATNLEPVMTEIEALGQHLEECIDNIELPEAYDDSEVKEHLERHGQSVEQFLQASAQTIAEVKSMLQERSDIDGSLKQIVEKLNDALDMAKMRTAFESINKPKEPQEKAPRFEKPKLI
jgi:hypothetical protein